MRWSADNCDCDKHFSRADTDAVVSGWAMQPIIAGDAAAMSELRQIPMLTGDAPLHRTIVVVIDTTITIGSASIWVITNWILMASGAQPQMQAMMGACTSRHTSCADMYGNVQGSKLRPMQRQEIAAQLQKHKWMLGMGRQLHNVGIRAA